MAVEITGITTTPLSDKKTSKINTVQVNTNNLNNSPASTPDVPVTATDTVTLTRRAKELRMIEKNINTQSDIDNKRIETLKLAIDTGQYNIDPLRVAEKLIAFETQFVA